MKHITYLALAAVAAVLAAAPTRADGTKPGADKSFGDWVLHCTKPGAAESACALHQKIMSRETKLPVAAFTMARNKASRELRVAVVLPLGLDIPAGVSAKVGATPIPFTVQTCVRRGCISSATVDEALLETLHGAESFTTTFKMRSVSEPTTLTVSLKGLAEGLKALESK